MENYNKIKEFVSEEVFEFVKALETNKVLAFIANTEIDAAFYYLAYKHEDELAEVQSNILLKKESQIREIIADYRKEMYQNAVMQLKSIVEVDEELVISGNLEVSQYLDSHAEHLSFVLKMVEKLIILFNDKKIKKAVDIKAIIAYLTMADIGARSASEVFSIKDSKSKIKSTRVVSYVQSLLSDSNSLDSSIYSDFVKVFNKKEESYEAIEELCDSLKRNKKRCDDFSELRSLDLKTFDMEDKFSAIIELLALKNKKIAIIGARGSGKSALMLKILASEGFEMLGKKAMYLSENASFYFCTDVTAQADAQKRVLFADNLFTLSSDILDKSEEKRKFLHTRILNDFESCVISCTELEYSKYIEKDEFVKSKFIPIRIEAKNGVAAEKYAYDRIVELLKDAKIAASKEVVLHLIAKSKELRDEQSVIASAIGLVKDIKNKIKSDINPETRLSKDIVNSVALALAGDGKLKQAATLNSKSLKEFLMSSVFGQDDVISEVHRAFRKTQLPVDKKKPKFSAIFAGPTSVGKTYMASKIAEYLGYPVIRLDMSEYSEKHSISKLIGSPPGYVGYSDVNTLSEKIRVSDKVVIILDEFEKADPAVQHLFLQMLDYGKITDSSGLSADCRNTVIVATTNASEKYSSKSAGFFADQAGKREESLEYAFSPELRARFGVKALFKEHTKESLEKVVLSHLDELISGFSKLGVSVEVSDDFKKEFVKLTNSKNAREIKEEVENVFDEIVPEKLYNLLSSDNLKSIKLGTDTVGCVKVDVLAKHKAVNGIFDCSDDKSDRVSSLSTY